MIKGLRNPHLVFVVEDNPDSAKEVQRILSSLGLECVVAGTQRQAEAFLRERRACLTLLDLAFPVDEEGEPTGPEAGFPGLVLLRRMRTVFGLGKDVLPVIVMTAYPQGFTNSVKAFLEGANDFLGKPFRLLEQESPEEKITRWLKQGCEAHHATCPHAGKGRKPEKTKAPRKREREYTSEHRLHLHGGPGVKQRRHRAELNGELLDLRETWIRALFCLAEHDRKPGDGFLAASLFGFENVDNVIYTLRKELTRELHVEDLIYSDRSGRHRLTCPPENVTYSDEVMRATFEWYRRARPEKKPNPS